MDYEIDQESLDLIIQLQLEDAQSMAKGKYREGEAPDFDLALELFNAELESLHAFIHDREMGRSLARAVVNDADVIRELCNEEDQATRDRMLALRGFDGDAVTIDDIFPDGEPSDTDSLKGAMSDEMVNKLIVLFHGDDDPAPSTAESSKKGKQNKRTLTCDICSEEFPFVDILQCPCSHDYCRGCLSIYVSKAINDESMFPPRCCGQGIPLDGVNQIFISADILGKYRAKVIEYESANRVYCSMPNCSTFIPTQFIKDEVATCVKCESKTCTICKGPSHEDECPKDTATVNFLRMADENNWRRCFKCRRVVELTHGCNHIRCHCSAEFCYVCGKLWQTCSCDLWNANRLADLNAAANQAADGQPQVAIEDDIFD